MISSKKKLAFWVSLTLTLVLTMCRRASDPLRDSLSFDVTCESIRHSLLLIEDFLEKIPKNEVYSCSLDDSKRLFMNGQNLGLVTDSISRNEIRNHYLFSSFSDQEYNEFLSTLGFLYENNIDYSLKDNLSGFYVHGYRQTDENSFEDLRKIIVSVDTNSHSLKSYYRVLDNKCGMVLVMPIDSGVW